VESGVWGGTCEFTEYKERRKAGKRFSEGTGIWVSMK